MRGCFDGKMARECNYTPFVCSVLFFVALFVCVFVYTFIRDHGALHHRTAASRGEHKWKKNNKTPNSTFQYPLPHPCVYWCWYGKNESHILWLHPGTPPSRNKKKQTYINTHTRTNEKSVENMYTRSCPTRKITVIGRGGVAPAPAELLGARGSEPGERKNKSGKNVYMSTMKMCIPFGYHRVHKAHLPPPCAHLIIVARRK